MLNSSRIPTSFSDLSASSNIKIPFVSGFALQNYLSAESGIIEASINKYDLYYIDVSIDSDLVANWDKQRINTMRNLIEKYHVKPILHGNYRIPLASDIPELWKVAINYIKKEINLASKLSASLIIHGGVIVEPRTVIKSKKSGLENFLKSVNDLLDYADKKGVTLYLENLSNYKNHRPFHYIFTHDEEFQYILDATHIPFFFDVGHSIIGDGNPEKIIKKYHDRIVGMSFSNNDGVRDLHLGLDNGVIDYHRIVSTMIQCNWHGIIAFETRDRTPSNSINDLYDIYKKIATV